jgi:AraC-like DNA-binding protein
MHFHFSFYSSILLIFFTHGVLFSVLLLRKAVVEMNKPCLWMAGFTFTCTLNIVPWMLGHAGWYSLQPYRNILFYFPFQNFFLLGPIIFFYTRALLNPGERFRKKDWPHFIPASLYVLYTMFMFAADSLILQHPYFYADGHDRDLDTWYRVAGIVSLSFYLFLSLRYYSAYKKAAVQILSFAETMLFRWVKRYLLALLTMQALDVLFLFLYPAWGSFTAKWWYYFVFSILFYYIAFLGYTNPIRPLFSFRLLGKGSGALLLPQSKQLLAFTPVLLLEHESEQIIETGQKKEDVPLEDDREIISWKVRLLDLMTDQEVYKDPEITLSSLARLLDTNASVLSKVVNKGFGVNFNDFINGYRVAAFQKYVAEGKHKLQTILGLSIDCGFNSKTTFNRVFKKHTGISPKEYIHQVDTAKEGGKPDPQNRFDVPDHDLGRLHQASPPSSSQINGI